MATEAEDLGMEEEVGSSEEPPASDFDAAADALAAELGASPTPGFRRALKEAIMSCMAGDYGSGGEEEEAPKDGLALVFGGKG